MPLVRIDIMEGRPPEKIRELHSRVAALVAEILDTPIERVRTYITQFPPEGWGIGGVPADVRVHQRPVRQGGGVHLRGAGAGLLIGAVIARGLGRHDPSFRSVGTMSGYGASGSPLVPSGNCRA